MKKLALMLAAPMALAMTIPLTPAAAWDESTEAYYIASDASAQARADMLDVFGQSELAPGKYLWDGDASVGGDTRVVVSLEDQLAFLYSDDRLVAVSTISSGKEGHATPTGIFPILEKKVMHHSRKYDNAPMPHMQRLDNYGIALHAGFNPGQPASHGCIRLPASFAAKLFKVTKVGTRVLIGA
jgi:hypothetical protein